MQKGSEKTFICRADFSLANVVPAFFACAAAQNWFEVTFNPESIDTANNDNDNHTTSKKKSKSESGKPGIITHLRCASLRGVEISYRWNPDIPEDERSKTFLIDYNELSKKLSSCTQKNKASLTVYMIKYEDEYKPASYILGIGDGNSTAEGEAKVNLTLKEASNFCVKDPGKKNIFFDLPVPEATNMVKKFQKNDNITLELYEHEDGNGLLFYNDNYETTQPFGYIHVDDETGENVEPIAKYNINYKLLITILKSQITKTSVIHVIYKEECNLKFWFYLANWGKMEIYVYD